MMTKGRYRVTNTTAKRQSVTDSAAAVTAHTYQQSPQIQLISGRAHQLANSGGKETAGRRPATNSATAPVRAGPAPSHSAAPQDTQGKNGAQAKQNNFVHSKQTGA